jgi:hypothetical protein
MNFVELRKAEVPLRRISLLRGWVNTSLKRKRGLRGVSSFPVLISLLLWALLAVALSAHYASKETSLRSVAQ